RLRRQATARPPAVRLGLVPTDLRHGMPRIERHDGVEAPLVPETVRLDPEERMLGLRPPAPVPGPPAPELPPRVPGVVDERLVLGIGDRRCRDAKRLDLDLVPPLLVVEDERLVRGGAEAEAASRDSDVVQAIPGIDGRIGGGGVLEGKNGARM